jgi:glycosyltransferase involved in cell wall biosynthesis
MRSWRDGSTRWNSVTADAAPDTAFVLVIVPAFNEAACIAGVVDDVRSAGFECLVVDDGSSDRTAPLADAAGARVVALPINLGVGGALRTGFRYAVDHGFTCIVQVDADGQHVAEHIDELLIALGTDNLDMVIGSRFAGDGTHRMSWARRSCIRMLAAVIARSGNTSVTDPTSGFRAIRSPLLDAFSENFPAHYLGDTFEATLVAARRGYRVGEVPVRMRERQGGQPSADGYASVRAMLRACTVLFTGSTFDLPRRAEP